MSSCDQFAIVQSKIGQSQIHMSIYRRVLRYYRPFLGQTILGLFLSLIGIGLNLLKPWPFKVIVDDFLRAGPPIGSDWRIWIPLLCLARSEEHTSELQSRGHLVCRLLL